MASRPIVVLRAPIAVVAIGALVRVVAATPWPMLALALGFAVATAALVVNCARRPLAWPPLLAAFGCGAAAAVLAEAVNAAAGAWLAGPLGSAEARRLAPMLVGPVVEETVKAVALAVVVGAWVERVDTVRDAVVYGALVGVGFATAENAEYFTLAAVRAGIAGLARAVWQRAVLGVAAHPVFTALVATAVPTWRRGSRRTAIATTLTALAAAVAQHTVWNAVAAPFIETRLCDAPTPAAPCRPVPPLGDLLVTAPLTVIVLTAPAIVFLARRTRPRAAAPRPS